MKRLPRAWTVEEDELVLNGTGSAASIAERIDRSTTSVYRRRVELRKAAGIKVMRQVQEERYFPVEPLLKAIDQQGGLAWLVRCKVGVLDPDTEIYKHPEYERIERALSRAKEHGGFDAYAADELCVGLARLHPMQVWGDLWFIGPPIDNEEEEDEAA